MVRLQQKKLHFQMKFTISMRLLMRLIPPVKLANRIFISKQKASGDKVLISINCEKCKMLHHINFSDNLLQILDFASVLSSNLNTNFIPSSQYVNLIQMKQKRKFFLLTD